MNRFIKDTKKYWKYTIYAAKSQLKTEVANSYLNWIWWILEPLLYADLCVCIWVNVSS